MASSTVGEYTKWYIAYTALVGVLILVLLPLLIASFFTIRQKRDTARRGFIWLKISLLFEFLSVTLTTAGYIIYILFVNEDYEFDYSNSISLSEAVDRLTDFGGFFDNFAQVFLWVALFDVGFGILYCWEKARRIRLILQVAAYIFAGVELLLALVVLGGWEQLYTVMTNRERGDYGSNTNILFNIRSFNLVNIAFDIILWVAVIAVTGLGILVMILARGTKQHTKSAGLLLGACVAFLIRTTYGVVMDFAYNIPGKSQDFEPFTILNAVLGVWFLVLALILLFVAGTRKAGGLWSTPQSFPSSKNQYYHATQPVMAQPPLHYGYR